MLFKKKEIKKENSEMKDFSLDKKIEAILFFKGDEVSLNFLVKILEEKKKDIKESILILRERLENSSLNLIEVNEKYLLSIRPEASSLIEKMKEKEEFSDLSPSALETLSIILYKEEIGRAEIDQIRGVNSSYILRNLLIRGLIEKKNENGATKYIPTLNLLSFLGIESTDKMPAFEEVRKKIAEIENNNSENSEKIKEEKDDE
jgi:segregation and condensation protein B